MYAKCYLELLRHQWATFPIIFSCQTFQIPTHYSRKTMALSLLAPDFCGGILVLNNFKFGENDSCFGGILQTITNHPINHPMLKINIQQLILTLMKTCIVKTMTWILSFRMIRRRFCSSLTVFHLWTGLFTNWICILKI